MRRENSSGPQFPHLAQFISTQLASPVLTGIIRIRDLLYDLLFGVNRFNFPTMEYNDLITHVVGAVHTQTASCGTGNKRCLSEKLVSQLYKKDEKKRKKATPIRPQTRFRKPLEVGKVYKELLEVRCCLESIAHKRLGDRIGRSQRPGAIVRCPCTLMLFLANIMDRLLKFRNGCSLMIILKISQYQRSHKLGDYHIETTPHTSNSHSQGDPKTGCSENQ
ncbi:hypothetical protein J6590_014964 [Homalodisca vitripennis]|nr:hypothetical protein J6590_014964 [Homalodisca vitripennis]